MATNLDVGFLFGKMLHVTKKGFPRGGRLDRKTKGNTTFSLGRANRYTCKLVLAHWNVSPALALFQRR
jgi:hypothetical protein